MRELIPHRAEKREESGQEGERRGAWSEEGNWWDMNDYVVGHREARDPATAHPACERRDMRVKKGETFHDATHKSR